LSWERKSEGRKAKRNVAWKKMKREVQKKAPTIRDGRRDQYKKGGNQTNRRREDNNTGARFRAGEQHSILRNRKVAAP